jgi:DNA mismatch repair ATPase MutS
VGAKGALSTHDVALTEMADLDGLGGCNVRMGSRSVENPLDFDYWLKPGVTTEASALAIAKMMGVLGPV